MRQSAKNKPWNLMFSGAVLEKIGCVKHPLTLTICQDDHYFTNRGVKWNVLSAMELRVCRFYSFLSIHLFGVFPLYA